MTKTAAAFGMAALLATASALAQPAPANGPRGSTSPSAGQTLTAPYTRAPEPPPAPQRRRLFTIFNMPVVVWAPVQPPYDSGANLDPAANPSWLDGGNPM
ncbi:MAG TPA: hypothetical protein DDZ81_19195 [Acetobacteraceae bacterium]|nr:hypothetical protein [Acetobacteraceae bacterium]